MAPRAKAGRKKSNEKDDSTMKKKQKVEEESDEDSSSNDDSDAEMEITPATKALVKKGKQKAMAKKKATSKKKETSSALTEIQSFIRRLEMPLDEIDLNTFWKQKYDELHEVKETKGQKVYEEAVRNIKEEKKMYQEWKKNHEKEHARVLEEMNTKIQNLEKNVNEKTKAAEDVVMSTSDEKEEMKLLQDENQKYRKEMVDVRLEMKELQRVHTLLKTSKSPDTKAATVLASSRALEISSSNLRLTEAITMLTMHEVLTGIHLNTAPPGDAEDSEDNSKYTDLICTVGPPHITKRLTFQMAIPNDPTEEVDYMPVLDTSTMTKIPDYLQEEISFKRSELPKFVKSLETLILQNRET